MSPVRTLVVEPAGLLYGSERVLLDTLDRLPPERIRAEVLLPSHTPLGALLRIRGLRTLDALPAEIHRRGRGARVRALSALVAAVVRRAPEVIMLNQAGYIRLVAPVARAFRIPVVVFVRLFDDVQRVAAALEAEWSPVVAALCVSQAVRSRFPKQLESRLRVLYDPFIPREMATPKEANFVVVTVGRVCASKGQDLVVEAAAALRQAGLPVQVRFVGGGVEGGFEAIVRARAALLGVPVEWAGVVKDVYPHLHGASVLASASSEETLGRVLFEAFDAGLVPVAYAGSGGPAEIMEASRAGILYAERTVDSLTGGLRRTFALDAGARANHVASGQRWVTTYTDPDRYAAELADVIVCAARGIPSQHGPFTV